ncbi:hypothetical protein F4779DRAFT_517383 [Xylariaceae sp. FL0662B]|nr:hypothetical protein F4779DRAFT_517383 [Xylariaceae sp. FL0662B]
MLPPIRLLFLRVCHEKKIRNPNLEGRCIDTNADIVAAGAINVVSDITILILPSVSISRLQMPWKTKVGVTAVFAVGIFACIASIIRLYHSAKLTVAQDFTHVMESVGSWGLGELTTVIIVACVPSFASLLRYSLRAEQARRSRKSAYPLLDDNNGKLQYGSSGAHAFTEGDSGSLIPLKVQHKNTGTI